MTGPTPPPVLFDDDPLKHYWNLPVSEIATLPPVPVSAAQAERHRIFSLALMALMEHYWNGNKNGLAGPYLWREQQAWPEKPGLWLNKPPAAPDKLTEPTDYLGHNIAAIAVDGNGEIIDFEFNHNELFDSSVEHAESRLVRRVFSLAQLGNRWNTTSVTPEPDYSTRLSNVSIYTSLESCAQCSGIMTLGRVKEVIYLQKDYGMFAVGNILYRLTHDPVTGRGKPVSAPRPIPANEFGLEYYTALDAAYREFFRDAKTKPFYNGKSTQSVSAFLCTDLAYAIYKQGADELASFVAKESEFMPESVPAAVPLPRALTNVQALNSARRFVDYAKNYASRGTSH